MVAGFAGSLAGIGLLNSVPSTGDTLAELVRTSWRRMVVAGSSALMAGYVAPMLAGDSGWTLGVGFLVGAGGQTFLAELLPWLQGRMRAVLGGERA